MKQIFKLFKKKDIMIILICVVFIVGQVWLDITLPDFMNEITNLLLAGGSTGEILKNGGFMLACALGSLILSVLVGFLTARMSANIGKSLREKIYDKVGEFSKADISKFSTSSLITRCTNDTTQVQTLVAMGLQSLIKVPILSTWAVVKILGKSWQWSVITLVALIIMLTLTLVIILLCMPRFKKIQKLTDDLNRVTRENLTGIRVVHAFNAEKYQQDKYEVPNEEVRKVHTFTSKAFSFFFPMISFLIGALSLGIYWIGAVIINNANMMQKAQLFSDMIVFSNYAMLIFSSIGMLVMIMMMLPRAIVSINRINEVLNTKPSIQDGEGVVSKQIGTIEFRNVSFKYPDDSDYVLSNISFEVKRGEKVAFIGSTGSGKTTLIDLIPRLYDATSGEVLVDGENVKNYKLDDLHDKIGYISQKSVIFSGSILDNITMGHDLEMQDVENALDYSQAKQFVDDMDEKEHSAVYQGGKNISGGQKQRLSIARALAKKPEILIFDDSFSALDYKTDKVLREALEQNLSDSTRLIVAQRIGTIMDVDKIIVLEKGKIVGIGTHQQLLENNSVYKQIALSQFNKEELYAKTK